jgi:hypothetical protein
MDRRVVPGGRGPAQESLAAVPRISESPRVQKRHRAKARQRAHSQIVAADSAVGFRTIYRSSGARHASNRSNASVLPISPRARKPPSSCQRPATRCMLSELPRNSRDFDDMANLNASPRTTSGSPSCFPSRVRARRGWTMKTEERQPRPPRRAASDFARAELHFSGLRVLSPGALISEDTPRQVAPYNQLRGY